jgi:flavin-dependent dehydrogenase
MTLAGSSSWHVAVVGGGPAGLASAIGLAREGLTSLVIERSNYERPRVGEHLPPKAKLLFGALGLSGMLDAGQHLLCPGVRSVWGSYEIADKDYLFSPYGSGVNVSRPELDRSLAEHAANLGVRIATRSKVQRLSRAARSWEVTYTENDEPRTAKVDFIVDATGRAASIAKRLGASPLVYDDLVGLVGYAASSDAESRVYLEAVPTGWWYSTRLQNNTVVAVFMTDAGLLDPAAGVREAWERALENAPVTRSRMRHLAKSSDPYVRTARSQRLDKMQGTGWLAVGDAAMSYDPLSSEGISKGLEWGRKAACAVSAMARGDRAAGEAYADEAGRAFSSYLGERQRYYAAEKRWRSSAFWTRRQSPPFPVG